MTDEGWCLRVDQPSAGLLVCGIKQHEGIDEYTDHRGRLWIVASSKVPTVQEIREVETFYIKTRGTMLFPNGYPHSYLVGCVDVENCISHDDYLSKQPKDPETDSDYVLVCKNPRFLPQLQFHHPGTEKLHKLDPLMHEAAANVLKTQTPNPLLWEELK